MKGLFLMFEGIPKTIVDSQVFHHARAMKEHGIEFEIWTFAVTASQWRASYARLAKIRQETSPVVRLFRAVRPAIPGSESWNGRRLLQQWKKTGRRYDFIHARTEYAAVVGSRIRRRFSIPLIWDCRGDSVAEFLEAFSRRGFGAGCFRWLKARRLTRRVLRAARACDAALFISRELMENVLPGPKPPRVEFVPCTAPRSLFSFAPSLRRSYRQRLRIPEETPVVVYSGSMAHYQCFPETVELVRRLHRDDPRILFLVLTPYQEPARTWLQALERNAYRLLSVPYREVNGYLNAADFAVMLRRPNRVNAGALPVKFAEYCLAGLPVILSQGAPLAVRLAQTLGNWIPAEDLSAARVAEPFSPERRAEISRRAVPYLAYESTIDRFVRLYREIAGSRPVEG